MLASIRSRPKHLELRRTSSCSALPLGSARNRQQQQQNNNKSKIGCEPSFCCYNQKNSISSCYKGPLIVLKPVAEGVEHVSQLADGKNSRCHFCEEFNSKAHQDCTKLKIVSRGNKTKMSWLQLQHRLQIIHQILFIRKYQVVDIIYSLMDWKSSLSR